MEFGFVVVLVVAAVLLCLGPGLSHSAGGKRERTCLVIAGRAIKNSARPCLRSNIR
ncbi:MAG: hypothetical protein ACLQJ7_14555 [Syntrophobacteraceae bacterium]